MTSRRRLSGRARLRLPGLILVALALFGQLGTGALAFGMPGPDVGSAGPAVAFLGVLCHSGGDSSDPAPHRGGDCALCPLCLSLAAAYPRGPPVLT
jgi:hypothetical protein